jgi:hypothetical protein
MLCGGGHAADNHENLKSAATAKKERNISNGLLRPSAKKPACAG